MITGIVTKWREAVLDIELGGVDAQAETVTATIDTGFDGFLALPSQIISQLGFPFLGLQDVILADGSTAALAFHEATIVWHGMAIRVDALEAEGGSLIGMALLEGCNLNIDIVENGLVRIERLDSLV
jgi:clan AA aspartic protease